MIYCHPSLSNRAALAHKQHEPYHNPCCTTTHSRPLVSVNTIQVPYKMCTLDDKIVARPRQDCMATKHCHAVLSRSCTPYQWELNENPPPLDEDGLDPVVTSAWSTVVDSRVKENRGMEQLRPQVIIIVWLLSVLYLHTEKL